MSRLGSLQSTSVDRESLAFRRGFINGPHAELILPPDLCEQLHSGSPVQPTLLDPVGIETGQSASQGGQIWAQRGPDESSGITTGFRRDDRTGAGIPLPEGWPEPAVAWRPVH